MEKIEKYFLSNLEEIKIFIKNEKHIFPKMFFLETEDIFINNWYQKIKKINNPLVYFFNIENISIFNIQKIEDEFYFKSNMEYKVFCLFFSNNHVININNKKIESNLFFYYNSQDEVLIKNGNFLKFSYLEKNNLENEDLFIICSEKNIVDEFKKKKNLLKNSFSSFIKNNF